MTEGFSKLPWYLCRYISKISETFSKCMRDVQSFLAHLCPDFQACWTTFVLVRPRVFGQYQLLQAATFESNKLLLSKFCRRDTPKLERTHFLCITAHKSTFIDWNLQHAAIHSNQVPLDWGLQCLKHGLTNCTLSYPSPHCTRLFLA